MTAATSVTVVRDGSVATLILDGAARLNPIGTATCTALASAVCELEGDRRVRAVVVHGAGRTFSAGADIDEIAGFDHRDKFEQFIHTFTDALELIEASPLPFVAAIDGAAMGGGLELALACDLRVVYAAGKLALPEAKLGVLPGAGGTQRLPRLLPRGIATEMIMLGRTLTGARAYELGLANHLSDSPESVLSDARALAEELVAGAALVPQMTKTLLRETATCTVADGIVRERAVATDLHDSADGREGFRAFVEKRAPRFEVERR
ncbi:enoyl-CoA hydratase/isomerase family protein [Nocardia flavorosea]|uniref:Enoyl-CoA hydratase/isomerase family protein n=1 Tax=Nocardia flavorosea TaxID=53429 RepID=A0A846YU94_9NOCA|nr:enoyl-CoA hydratase/isomerase family protein [Nocardia flavorosea]NKY61024.1 enoyl-CoA hydratase/isomerase family protein [Nocardia flavorosea]